MRCQQCNQELIEKRAGAIYCNHNCRQKNYKRRKTIQNRIVQLENEIYQNQEWLNSMERNLSFLGNRAVNHKNLSYQIRQKKRIRKSSNEQLKEWLLQQAETTKKFFSKEISMLFSGTRKEQFNALHFIRRKLRNDLLGLEKMKWQNIEEMSAEKERLISEIRLLKLEWEKLKKVDLKNLPNEKELEEIQEKEKNSPKNLPISSKEIARMNFDGIVLNGDLGKFLGKLGREKCAIVLTGDSGAGKTTFSFTLAKNFLEKGLSTVYFALESGITEEVQDLVKENGLDHFDLPVFYKGKLEDVQREAPNYDCVIIDSYSKIADRPEAFEELRQEFPDTYFVIIFQKTTTGTVRGGSSIIFNSTAAIDIKQTKSGRRMAFMKKSRYGTENFVFSTDQQKLLKATKNPISWNEIEERWGDQEE
ncbi:MAG: hypothetical protein EP338_07885 [Bacteroidetes bacterium]|nr:MAG: hypothetical protein EP338_07885 [Bacteroidota bacterium]